MTDYEKGVRDTLINIGGEVDCCDNGNLPHLTVKAILEPRSENGLTTSKLLKRLQNQIRNMANGWGD